MIIKNRYAGKCTSCSKQLSADEGFAAKQGMKWIKVCNSSACFKRLGLPDPNAPQERKITEDGFIIMPYDPGSIILLNSLPGAKWIPETKQWSCSLNPGDLPRVVEIADQLSLEVPQSLRDKAKEGTVESKAAEIRANKTYNGKQLFPFQKVGVKFLSLRDKALLGDDPGIGKTIQALIALPEKQSVLIVCPSSLKYNWKNEINIWRQDYVPIVCEGKESFKLPNIGEMVIINYDSLPDWLLPTENKVDGKTEIIPAKLTKEQKELLGKTTFIVDECQAAANYKSKRHKKINTLSCNCMRVWFLSGTPMVNRPTDLYGVLQAGNMNVLGSWDKFVKLFNGFKNAYNGYEFRLPTAEVAERMKRIMLRRLKSEVLPDLPTKTYQTITVGDLGKKLEDYLNNITIQLAINQGVIEQNDSRKEININDLISKLELSSLPSFSQFSEVRALLAESKIPAMLEIVESYEESETPLVVFSAHRKPIDILKARPGWAVITGDTENEERNNIVNRFQNGDLKGIGLTIQSGGVGITLTNAFNMLFVDRSWTPAENIQAEDRIIRIGQKSNKALIMRLQSNHPLDIHMQNLIEYKMEMISSSLESSFKYTPIVVNKQKIELIEETEEQLFERIKKAESYIDRSWALNKLSEVSDRECNKVVHIPLPELTLEKKNILREALELMCDNCDGAKTKDGIGFNKPDASIGHWISKVGLQDSDNEIFRLLERILCRYRKQLGKRFSSIWEN